MPVLVRTTFWTLCLLALVMAAGSACRKQHGDSPAAQAAAPATPADPAAEKPGDIPAPSKDGLVTLSGDSNPYIKNNAKQALESWEAGDYAAAAIAMQKVVSLCRTADQQSLALSSLAQLKQDVDNAAARGDAGAKEAQVQLAQ